MSNANNTQNVNIGEVIRHYRKARNLTQEQVAKSLGVTPPAVNKWERGASLPDVALLAPLSRLLGISCDTLLTYKENLSLNEINQLCQQAQQKLETETFAEVVDWAHSQMKSYPNCEQLALNLMTLLDAWRAVKLNDDSAYAEFIRHCLEQLLANGSQPIRTKAAELLFNIDLRQENYAQAEKYLSYFPVDNFERQHYQALIYNKTKQTNEAWQAYEQLLFATGNRLSLVLHELFGLAKQDNNAAKAQALAAKQKLLARLLEMGVYHETTDEFAYAVWRQDAEATVQIMEQLLSSASTPCAFINSPLYEHMQFKQPSADFSRQFKQQLLAQFCDLDNFSFLQQNSAAYQRWQKICAAKDS